jgi:tRNA (guanine37-N1)-methyltransferase
MPKLTATFIAMFNEPINSWLNTSIIARAQKNNVLSLRIASILESVAYNHHAVDDTPYGGGPGELMKIDIIVPLIKRALEFHGQTDRVKQRVILMDPAGVVFTQKDAERLALYEELVFVCGRYEGIDARIHHYVDEALSVGDFILSSGDLAAMAICDATVRMVDGVLGNKISSALESHSHGRLEASHYTRPAVYDGREVPSVFKNGHHQEIEEFRMQESAYKTSLLRPDLLTAFPLSSEEKILLAAIGHPSHEFPWEKKNG